VKLPSEVSNVAVGFGMAQGLSRLGKLAIATEAGRSAGP